MPTYRIDPSRPGRLVCQDCGLAVAGLPRRPCSPGVGCPPVWDDDRPPAPPDAVRRQLEPHRVRVLRPLSMAALACGLLSLFLVAPAAVAIPLGVAVAAAARRDLARMGGGLMDPSGRGATERAEDWASLGAFLATAPLAIAVFLALMIAGWWALLKALGGA